MINLLEVEYMNHFKNLAHGCSLLYQKDSGGVEKLRRWGGLWGPGGCMKVAKGPSWGCFVETYYGEMRNCTCMSTMNCKQLTSSHKMILKNNKDQQKPSPT